MADRLPRGSLDRDRILRAAEDLAGRSGLEQVTIRRVASDLGVQHPAVHYHFPKRDDLVDALLANAVDRFNALLPEVTSDDWQVHLRSYWEAFRAVLRGDPALLELMVMQWAVMGHSQEALNSSYARIDAQLGVLLDAGFSLEQAGYAYHLLSNYTRGCLLSERQFALFSGAAERGEPIDDRPVTLPGKLADYPHLRAVSGRQWSYTFATDADFDQGLTVIIEGLEAGLPASR